MQLFIKNKHSALLGSCSLCTQGQSTGSHMGLTKAGLVTNDKHLQAEAESLVLLNLCVLAELKARITELTSWSLTTLLPSFQPNLALFPLICPLYLMTTNPWLPKGSDNPESSTCIRRNQQGKFKNTRNVCAYIDTAASSPRTEPALKHASKHQCLQQHSSDAKTYILLSLLGELRHQNI